VRALVTIDVGRSRVTLPPPRHPILRISFPSPDPPFPPARPSARECVARDRIRGRAEIARRRLNFTANCSPVIIPRRLRPYCYDPDGGLLAYKCPIFACSAPLSANSHGTAARAFFDAHIAYSCRGTIGLTLLAHSRSQIRDRRFRGTFRIKRIDLRSGQRS